jgi:MoaA/NifB/PqqE/SkfB family radical SAM enzyme
MPLSEAEYHAWFSDATTPVGPQHCNNVERLIDIQPDGSANFCVDFPDVSIGSVRESTIAEVWNSEIAQRFRAYRREKSLPICLRCGSKYMSEMG